MAPRNARQPKSSVSLDQIARFRDDNGFEWTVGAELKVIDGRTEITAISIWNEERATPLTRRVLRDIQLERLFRQSIVKDERNGLRTIKRTKPVSAHKGRPHTNDELAAVADIYMAAFRAHEPVQRCVADALGISVSTAAKRIMAARRQGLLD